MKSDIEIAQATEMLPITQIADKLGIAEDSLIPYGKYKAKIDVNLLSTKTANNPKLILVTAINPTPAGEGKTTVTVGLGDALNALKKHVVICLREPSLGPVFGVKGGAAGGGYAQIIPMEDINLHFTGDIHAITTAHNLLAAMLDNHIHQGNALNIDLRRITWGRVLDMNERQLRNIIGGLGGKANGMPIESHFDITAASEVMAVFCLSENITDLKVNLAKIVVAYSTEGNPVTAGDLKAQGAMAALLKDAFNPNLVQTLEHTPTLIHGGPFGNIAHGCNSIRATQLGLALAQDYVVTEAGFGADLGAEKFFDIKCRKGGFAPNAAVVVATIRALKHHGGCSKDSLNNENLPALENGIPNLLRHLENIQTVYGVPTVVALNRFGTDSDAELNLLQKVLSDKNIPVALTEVFAKGGQGGLALAQEIIKIVENNENDENQKPTLNYSYNLDSTIKQKITAIATKIYGASKVNFEPAANRMIRQLEKDGYANLPICMAKTQYSFSDNAKLLGAPTNFEIKVRQLKLSAGAGFIVALAGDIMTMPGLPATPAAENIDINENGVISGLF
ncbi:MAG: formate--tetrahydrofolate ligase [Firmicutes bacterium]|nr:formate--tetrahydrofolate ligase [Bacillota bacterium]